MKFDGGSFTFKASSHLSAKHMRASPLAVNISSFPREVLLVIDRRFPKRDGLNGRCSTHLTLFHGADSGADGADGGPPSTGVLSTPEGNSSSPRGFASFWPGVAGAAVGGDLTSVGVKLTAR